MLESISQGFTDHFVIELSGSSSSSSSSASNEVNNNVSTRINDVQKEIKRVRAQMEEDEQLSVLMRGRRGQNLKDSVFADDNIQLRLVETGESSEFLPLVYDPATISAYWGKRPRAVASRVIQLLSVAGGFLSRLPGDIINKKVKENEVARAIELREIVTSVGPAYIKLGQALSIRPDILSPAAMTELQKLCDKVPSFPDDVAMALNGTYFAEMMKKDLPQVVVRKTYQKYTSRKVLTTQWIDGEKLSQNIESDVGELVNVGVICYLKLVLWSIINVVLAYLRS